MKTVAGVSEEFDIGVGVHQGPLLFIAVMDETSREAKNGGPWELVYTDDVVLMAESE